ncbi:MAG: ABC transporter ATP-binding protein [Spirochaetales bacterium]|uniref:ABC transporter ATP-binding protein n=1 Tax=Candidatus Thalassospirochaeta sargassi TaxID=3119039 RepID=A0AAJ1IGV8_9SPIO|nr:ABC transporter ATP-binding protein [Spirochaetales bacterium]
MSFLKIDSLTHRFGGLTAVSDLNYELEEGGIYGLIGPNGAGKTTVFNLVSGFYNPSEGKIQYRGEELNGLPPHDIAARQIGRTFQNIRLWSEMTVLDNIKISQHYQLGYGLPGVIFKTKKYRDRERKIEAKAMELLEEFNLTDLACEYPKNLSYGVQRRVEIARALSLGPKLLMLDEPAAGLSTSDVVELIDYIRWVHENFKITIWMIEHQMQVIMTLCDRIKVIDFGKEIADGLPDEIRNNPQVIKAYLGDGEI